MLAMFFTDHDLYAILTGAAFFIWFFIFQLFDFHYVEFIYDKAKITLRYYPAVKFGKKEYNSIEFTEDVLHEARFETSFMGLVHDLSLAIKTKRGVAEYPDVSLTAVSGDDRNRISEILNGILEKQ